MSPRSDGALRDPHRDKTAAGFSAVGALTLRGVTKDVPIEFQFAPRAAGAKLSGGAELNRLDFGVGQGDRKSTERIGDGVKMNFSLGAESQTEGLARSRACSGGRAWHVAAASRAVGQLAQL